MVLVDEKMLDYKPMLQHFEDKQLTRPTEQTVKSSINKQMESTLDDTSIPEDVKAKQYRQNLNRFLQTKRKLPVVEPTIGPTVNEILDIKSPKKRKRKVVDIKVKRVSKRVSKKPKRYEDFKWEKW